MIVVVGNPIARTSPAGTIADGPAAAVAMSAAAAGAGVQLVARVVDDAAGDAMLQHLANAGVSHVATLRQPATEDGPVIEAADLELGPALPHRGRGPGPRRARPGPDGGRRRGRRLEPRGARRDPAARRRGPDRPPAGGDRARGARRPTRTGRSGPSSVRYAAALDRGVDAATAFKTTITEAGDWSRVGELGRSAADRHRAAR